VLAEGKNEARLVIVEGKQVVEVILTQGKVTIIDLDDWELIRARTWGTAYSRQSRTPYALTSVPLRDGRWTKIYLHRFLLKPKPGVRVDHKNHDGLDNRRSNLRFATAAESARNTRSREGSSSKYKGVTWDKNRKKWNACIKLGPTTYMLGRFDSETKAALAYNKRAREEYGEFAYLNSIEEAVDAP
jgi:hypothetical protein